MGPSDLSVQPVSLTSSDVVSNQSFAGAHVQAQPASERGKLVDSNHGPSGRVARIETMVQVSGTRILFDAHHRMGGVSIRMKSWIFVVIAI